MNAEKGWNELKNYIAVISAGMLWVVSVIFFMVGFAVATSGGMYLPGFPNFNIAPWIAFTISLVNSFIQITWNGEKEDIMEWGLWGASYGIGIFSNYLGLIQIFNMSDPMIEKGLAICIGVMIEVAPEKLLIRGLREIKLSMPKFSRSSVSYRPSNNQPKHGQGKPQSNQPGYRGPQQSQQGKSTPAAISRPLYSGEPTYHPFDKNAQASDKPVFRPTNYSEGE